VDNIIITDNNTTLINILKKFLHSRFHIKNLRNLKHFLRIEVARSKRGIYLSQRKHALDIMHDIENLSGRPCDFPMEQNLKTNTGWLFLDPSWCRQLVGHLLYYSTSQLPDQTSSILSMSLAHSWANPEILIGELLLVLFVTSNRLSTLASYSLHLVFSSYMHVMILIGPVVQWLMIYHRLLHFSLAIVLFLGNQSSKGLSHNHLLNLNIDPWHVHHVKSHGKVIYLLIYVYHFALPLYIVIIR